MNRYQYNDLIRNLADLIRTAIIEGRWNAATDLYNAAQIIESCRDRELPEAIPAGIPDHDAYGQVSLNGR